MIRRLILLRHARAAPARGQADHQRSLESGGLIDARHVGQTIGAAWLPDFALVSDARRTRETFDEVATGLGHQPAVRVEPALYEATPDTIVGLIRIAPAEAGCLLVVGHNPGMAEAARRLAASGAPDDLARLRGGFPTAAFAVIRFDGPGWSDIDPPGGVLEAYRWVGAASG